MENTALIKSRRENQLSIFNKIKEEPVNVKTLPYILTAYIHFIFNFLILSAISFTIFFVFYIIHNEIEIKVQKEKEAIEIKKSECKYNYEINKCSLKIPYLANKCMEWKNEINREYKIRYGKIVVEVLSELIDIFVIQMSWKMIAVFSILFISYFILNKSHFFYFLLL